MKIDFKKALPNKSVPKPWKALLERFVSKKINEDEFNQELAYGALESIEALAYKSLPVMPAELSQLLNKRKYSKNPKEIEKLNEGINAHVRFFDSRSKTETENLGNRLWLKRYLSWIPEEDQVSRAKIIEVIKTHDPYFRPRDQRADIQRPARDVSTVSEPPQGDAPQDSQHQGKPQTVS